MAKSLCVPLSCSLDGVPVWGALCGLGGREAGRVEEDGCRGGATASAWMNSIRGPGRKRTAPRVLSTKFFLRGGGMWLTKPPCSPGATKDRENNLQSLHNRSRKIKSHWLVIFLAGRREIDENHRGRCETISRLKEAQAEEGAGWKFPEVPRVSPPTSLGLSGSVRWPVNLVQPSAF